MQCSTACKGNLKISSPAGKRVSHGCWSGTETQHMSHGRQARKLPRNDPLTMKFMSFFTKLAVLRLLLPYRLHKFIKLTKLLIFQIMS
jgi:hypothetical protein